MANDFDEDLLACSMLDEAGAEAGTISPENARGAAVAGQPGGFTQSLGSRVLIGTQMPSGAVHPITPLASWSDWSEIGRSRHMSAADVRGSTARRPTDRIWVRVRNGAKPEAANLEPSFRSAPKADDPGYI